MAAIMYRPQCAEYINKRDVYDYMYVLMARNGFLYSSKIMVMIITIKKRKQNWWL